MLKKSAALALVTTSAMLSLTACSADHSVQPYGLTGEPTWNEELRERQRWTDDKGRYRSDWRHGHADAPPGYPKPIAN